MKTLSIAAVALLVIGSIIVGFLQGSTPQEPEKQAIGLEQPLTSKPTPSTQPSRFLLVTKEGKPFPPFPGSVKNRVILRGTDSRDGEASWMNKGAACRLQLIIGNYATTFGGAEVEQVLLGFITHWYGYTVDSDQSYPLVFKWVKDVGCVRLCGRGTMIGPDDRKVSLGKEDTVDSWMAEVRNEDVLMRQGAAAALGYLPQTEKDRKKVVPALVALLKDPQMAVRRDAAESLGRIGEVAAAESLVSLLDDQAEQWWPAEVAAESIAKIGGGLRVETITRLVQQLNGKENKKAALAATALAAAGKEAIEPLLLALNHPEKDVRMNAACSLGAFRDARAITPLQKQLEKEKDGDVRDAIERAIKKIELPPLPPHSKRPDAL